MPQMFVVVDRVRILWVKMWQYDRIVDKCQNTIYLSSKRISSSTKQFFFQMEPWRNLLFDLTYYRV
jgi:hypothetical protein